MRKMNMRFYCRLGWRHKLPSGTKRQSAALLAISPLSPIYIFRKDDARDEEDDSLYLYFFSPEAKLVCDKNVKQKRPTKGEQLQIQNLKNFHLWKSSGFVVFFLLGAFLFSMFSFNFRCYVAFVKWYGLTSFQ